MLFSQRDIQAIISRRRLQFKVKAATEALAQRQPPGLIDTSAEGCMQDELLAAALVKETAPQ